MHAFYCHACLPLPCMPPTAMHVRTFRHWQLFFYAMSTVLLRCPSLPLPPTAVYLPLPYTSHCHACLPLPCMSPTAMHASHCHACLPLPCMPPTAMHAFHCHACLPLPCMPSTAMHASHCHACLPLPCMPPTAMHAFHCHACQDIPTDGKADYFSAMGHNLRNTGGHPTKISDSGAPPSLLI
jgi:hypothetical protein